MSSHIRGASLEYPLQVSKAVEGDPHIDQPEASRMGLVPEVAFRWMFSGPSNSGKQTLPAGCWTSTTLKGQVKVFLTAFTFFLQLGSLTRFGKTSMQFDQAIALPSLTSWGKIASKIYLKGASAHQSNGQRQGPTRIGHL